MLVLLATLFLAACSRPLDGVYQTQGSEDKFRMTLEIRADGAAKFGTRANLGNPELDRAVEGVLTIPEGRWTRDRGEIAISGRRGDGKMVTHRFTLNANGELIWKENGARFVKAATR